MVMRLNVPRQVRRAALAGIAGMLLALGVAAPAAGQSVARGIGVPDLATQPADERQATIAEIAGPLNATMLRIDLYWSAAEKERGVYDDAGYLAQIAATVDEAHSLGLDVIVTVYKTPRWASDSSYWNSPPQGYDPDTYYSFYPMKKSALPDFQAFAQHVATLLKGRVDGYECWNEPNLYPFLYPQQTGGDGAFAANTYAGYLRAFSAGVRAADPDARVIAGTTSPGGGNDRYRTSPQRFAQLLKNAGVADSFDVYSHHPYTVGGSADARPSAPPPNPTALVTMGNIKTLLAIWPEKPFYLTEYGYNTQYTHAFNIFVTEVVQARYLRQAYALAAKYPQIEMLMWWEVRDRSPRGSTYDPRGIYTGLRGLDEHRKRAWFAFAGGNLITLRAPTAVAPGDSVRLQGTYSCSNLGGVKGRTLLLQRKWGAGAWKTLRTVTTGDKGYYKTFVTPRRASRYRLVFAGVVASQPVLVRMK